MQNLIFENKYLLDKNKKQIKKLWLDNFFDDDEKTVDLFFKNVFENKKGVGAFLNNDLVAMILFLNSKIIFKNKTINSVYFYAVCTKKEYRNKGVMKNLFSFAKGKVKEDGFDSCFLVPENASLFDMYEKFGFKRTINYTEKTFCKNVFLNQKNILLKTDFSFSNYFDLRKKESEKSPVIIFEEDEFNFFFDKSREDILFIFTSSGYALYEKNNKEILIYEFCGSENEIVNALFQKHSDAEKVILRKFSEGNARDFGMTFSFDIKNNFNNIYFGMPYR